MENVIAKILCGGCRHDTTANHKDVDYLVILDEDIKCKRFYDNDLKFDYICYGKDFINKLLRKEETHINLPYILIDLMGQTNYKVNYDVLQDIEYVKQVYINWLTKDHNAIIKCIPRSKRIFYAFVLMYWAENNAYTLTSEQQDVINNIHQMIDIPENVIDKFIVFYGLNKWFKKELSTLVQCWKRQPKKTVNKINLQQKELDSLRLLRKKECFPIINRGQLWYSMLTAEQYKELQIWYQAWLDVTETLIVPEKPGWLE